MLRWISGAWAMLWKALCAENEAIRELLAENEAAGGAPRPAGAEEGAGSPAPPVAAGTPSAKEFYGVVREGLRDPGSGRCWWGEWEDSVNPFHARYQAAFERLRDFISARASGVSAGQRGRVPAERRGPDRPADVQPEQLGLPGPLAVAAPPRPRRQDLPTDRADITRWRRAAGGRAA